MVKFIKVFAFGSILLASFQNAHASRSGVASNNDAVGIAVADASDGEKIYTYAFSAVQIAPRCLLTAAHNFVDGRALQAKRYYQGNSPTTLKVVRDKRLLASAEDDHIPIIRFSKHDGYLPYTDRSAPPGIKDLALVWLSNKTQNHLLQNTGDANFATVIPPSTSSPIVYAGTTNPNNWGWLHGYGHNNSIQDPLMPMMYKDIGIGTRRRGQMYIALIDNPMSGGSLIIAKSFSNNQAGCTGDSGGPFITDAGQFVGITVGSGGRNGNRCDENDTTSFAGFTNGTDAWLATNIPKVCSPQMDMSISVNGSGNVVAVSNGSQVANCSNTPSDCYEDRLRYDATLTATAATGWSFDKWTDSVGSMYGGCKCKDSTNPTCIIPVADPQRSDFVENEVLPMAVEYANCTAEFKMNMITTLFASTTILAPTMSMDLASTTSPVLDGDVAMNGDSSDINAMSSDTLANDEGDALMPSNFPEPNNALAPVVGITSEPSANYYLQPYMYGPGAAYPY